MLKMMLIMIDDGDNHDDNNVTDGDDHEGDDNDYGNDDSCYAYD